MRLQHAAVDDDTRGTALTDREWRNDDIGDAAILFQRGRMADKRHGLALDGADAAEAVAAKRTLVARPNPVSPNPA